MKSLKTSQATHPPFRSETRSMEQGQRFLANGTADVLDVIVECCTLRKPARIIHDNGILDATFESASMDAVWLMISEPNGAFAESISPCSVAFVARCRPCFFLSRLYISHATKMFVHTPERIAVVERREARRYPITNDTELSVIVSVADESELPVQAVDLSSNGMLLQHDSAYKLDWAVGSRLHIRLRIDSQMAELAGMVRRRAGTNQYGIAFPSWISQAHLPRAHPFLRILSTVERNWFRARFDGPNRRWQSS